MREAFIEKRFNRSSVELIEKCNDIVKSYQAQGLRLTLRQLYYQLVSRNVIPNVEKSYKRLSGVISDARLAGEMDWSAIEDRVRRPQRSSQWDSIQELVESALYAYRLPRWEDQKTYCELWVEKDALAGVLQPLAEEFHVTLMVNRGYSSQSAMYDSAKRFKVHQNRKLVLLYLGDHDPSGEDMVRDIRDRMEMFGVRRLQVNKLALTMAQIEEYEPPPNPAKMTDPRAEAYVSRHGDESWEVDALPPDVLQRIIRTAIEGVVDMELYNEVIEREEEDKTRLREAAADL